MGTTAREKLYAASMLTANMVRQSVGGDALERPAYLSLDTPGVVNQYVETTFMFNNRLHKGGNRIFVAGIENDALEPIICERLGLL